MFVKKLRFWNLTVYSYRPEVPNHSGASQKQDQKKVQLELGTFYFFNAPGFSHVLLVSKIWQIFMFWTQRPS